MNSYSKTALAAAICTALSAGNAGAANFSVTNTNDAGTGSLRDALTQANANAEADIIDLTTVTGQTIALTSGQLEVDSDTVTINGADVTIDAGGNSRVLAAYYSDVTLNDLTITGGDSGTTQLLRGIGPAGSGGGIRAIEGNLEINDSEISGNSGAVGGGLFFFSEYGNLNLNDSVVSGNDATNEGGGVYASSKYGDVTFSGSNVSSNTAGNLGGGISVVTVDGRVTLDNTVVSGNSATGTAAVRADISQRRAEFKAARSNWGDGTRGDGGSYGYAGGAYIGGPFGDVEIRQSTISGNSASFGGGLEVFGGNGSILVEASTLSGNSAAYFGGAAVLRAKYDLQVRNSTISGNSSGQLNGGLVLYSELSGGGAVASTERGAPLRNILVDFTTITANSAPDIGGLGISSDISIPINASVISGNTATTDPDIGFNPAALTQADVNFSLVGVDSSSGALNFDATSSALLGQDPQLGLLADNGGPTFTHLPAATSPVVDVVTSGAVGCGDVVTSDQRSESRPFDAGCEAGSVERGVFVPPPAAVQVPVLDRMGLLLMAGLLGLVGLFGYRRRSEQKR